MRRSFFTISSIIALSSFILSSCETPVGQGAGVGAATGAIIGGAATGHVRGAAIGAAAGAAAGALIGAAVQEDQVARYGPPPPGGFPIARVGNDCITECSGQGSRTQRVGAMVIRPDSAACKQRNGDECDDDETTNGKPSALDRGCV